MLDFVYAGMHHSLDNMEFVNAVLEDKHWKLSVFINSYFKDSGYQSRDHINSKDLERFVKKYNPTYGFVNHVYQTPPTKGKYFSRNPSTTVNNDLARHEIQNRLNHAVGVDFGLVSQYAAENNIDVCDMDISEYLEKHRCYMDSSLHAYIRQATRDDLIHIANMFKGDKEFGFISNHMINNYIKDSTCITLVCCDITTKVIGVQLGKMMGDNSFQDGYNKVLEEHRGQGIGRKMFEVLVDCAKQIGSDYMYTTVLLHGKSKSFYEHLGFEQIKVIENSDKEPLLRMHLNFETEQKALF